MSSRNLIHSVVIGGSISMHVLAVSGAEIHV